MDQQKTRQHSWDQELKEWKKNHDFSHKASQLQSKLLKEIVETLSKKGIDLKPLLDKHEKETEKLIHQFQNQK